MEFNKSNGCAHAPMDDLRIRAFERLLRRLLAWSGQPAVITPQLLVPDSRFLPHHYFGTAEDLEGVLLEYYQQLSISMRAAMLHQQRQGVKGFTGAGHSHCCHHLSRVPALPALHTFCCSAYSLLQPWTVRKCGIAMTFVLQGAGGLQSRQGASGQGMREVTSLKWRPLC